VFDPVAILLAAKSGLDPSAYKVLRPDPAYFKSERFGNRLGVVGAVIFAIVWFVLIPANGVAAFFFPNPLARAGLYLVGFSIALAGLAAGFVILPRTLERQSRRVLILTPDGLILADWEQSEVVRAIDYRATDELTLEVDTNYEGPDVYRLVIGEPGKTRRWTVEEYFERRPKDIAARVMRDYAHAKEPASQRRRSAAPST
jgi:hypothetical protein